MPRTSKSPEPKKPRAPRSEKKDAVSTLNRAATLSTSTPLKKKRPSRATTQKKAPPKKREAKTVPATEPSSAPSFPSLAPLTSAKISEQKTPLRAPTKMCMSSAQCFLYGGLVCLAGTIILGLFLGFIVLAPLATQYEQTHSTSLAPAANQAQALNELENTVAQTAPSATQNENGFYGTLLSQDNGVLMVKELNPSLPLEKKSTPSQEKTFAVKISDKTGYTYQRPRDEKNSAAPLFTPEQGQLTNLKQGMYVFVSTPDDTSKAETVTASHILYSEKSPFAE